MQFKWRIIGAVLGAVFCAAFPLFPAPAFLVRSAITGSLVGFLIGWMLDRGKARREHFRP